MTYQTYDEELLCMFYAQKEELRKLQETINKLQETAVRYGDSIRFKNGFGCLDTFGKTIVKDFIPRDFKSIMQDELYKINSMMED